MWVLNSISQIPFKKPFLVLTGTLGAGFLLLAFLFGFSGPDPLLSPWIYTILAIDFAIVFSKKTNIRLALLLGAASFVFALILLPQYLFVFVLLYMALLSKVVAKEYFRVWKWLFASALLYVAIGVASVWQHVLFASALLPGITIPAAHGILFGFAAYCSFVPCFLRKDRVLEALDYYDWDSNLEGSTLADQIKNVYTQTQASLQDRDTDSWAREELEDFTERMIHLCFRLQQVTRELSPERLHVLNRQIAEISELLQSTQDSVAKIQYEQALENKQRQKDYYEDLNARTERIRSQLMNFLSSLENLRFLYANQEIRTAGTDSDPVNLFLDLAKARAENG